MPLNFRTICLCNAISLMLHTLFTRLELYEVDGVRGTAIYLTYVSLNASFIATP